MNRIDTYRAAHESAAVIDRSDRVRMEATGLHAQATLNGLLTNDTTRLKAGEGHYAAALTNKGKIIADVRVFSRGESFFVDTSAAAGPGLLAMLKKYVNPRLAKVRDVSGETGMIGVFGPESARVIGEACGVDPRSLDALGLFAHVDSTIGGVPCTIARVPDLGVAGFDIIVPASAHAMCLKAVQAGGAPTLDAATAEVLRVEAGRPVVGADMDENTLAQEAALDAAHLSAISFDKGCYTGQETVARVHFRGHVNRTLRGLRCAALVPPGALISSAEQESAGDVRSVAQSPRFGAIALAYVRREIADGAPVTIRWSGGETAATVTSLPFA